MKIGRCLGQTPGMLVLYRHVHLCVCAYLLFKPASVFISADPLWEKGPPHCQGDLPLLYFIQADSE